MGSGIYLQPVADNAGVIHQSYPVIFRITRDGFDIEIMIRPSKSCFFFQNRLPAETCLIYLHHEPTEKLIVVMQRETVVMVMIIPVESLFLLVHGLYGTAVGHDYSVIVTFMISTFLNGRSPLSVGTVPMMSTISMPFTTLPKTLCLPSSHVVSSAWTMKNWLPLVFGPAFAIEIWPFLWESDGWNSSSNFSP